MKLHRTARARSWTGAAAVLVATWGLVPLGIPQKAEPETDRTCLEDPDGAAVTAAKQPLGRIAFEVREQDSGALVPSRLLFLSTERPEALPTVGRFRNVWTSASGKETKLVPAGRYDVYVSRGTGPSPRPSRWSRGG